MPNTSATSLPGHIPPADRQVMREIVAKGDLAVFIQVDDLNKTFESLRAAGTEILQEPIDPSLRRPRRRRP